ncbi:MAG: branched-chain-amino-acid transaminase [Opitutales bacterium]
MKVFFKDRLVDQADAHISVFDHGLLYGDGVFEGIRLYQQNVFLLEEHLERLEYSAKAILLKLPMEREAIAEAVCETCRANQLVDGYIRLVVTRGPGSLGLSIDTCRDPVLFIIADTIQLYPKAYYEQGLKIITVPTRRCNPAALPPMVKSLNYLNNILAKIECQKLGYQEAIMLNDQGYIAECTGDNLFMVHKGTLYTPDTSAGALKGITRQVTLDIAAELEIPVETANLTRYDVWNAEEAFLTGTAAEIVPVVEIDHRPVGGGKPGEVTRRFLEAFRQRVTRDGRKL